MIYADDPDAHVVITVTDALGGDFDFDPVVRTGATDITAAWTADAAIAGGVSTRELDVPLSGLTRGSHSLRLVVPGDNDVALGSVYLI
jgi:hypothetical protein